jgi:hypothetical protein
VSGSELPVSPEGKVAACDRFTAKEIIRNIKVIQAHLKAEQENLKREQATQRHAERSQAARERKNERRRQAQAARKLAEEHVREWRRQKAAEAIQGRQADLQVSIETEEVYRRDALVTRRRQTAKDKAREN